MEAGAETVVDRKSLIHIAIAVTAMLLSWAGIGAASWLGVCIAAAGVFAGGYPIFHEALAAFRERRMTMELSMAIAIVAALTIREFFTALLIVVFVLIAEVLEHLTTSRGRKAIESLLRLLPTQVTVRREGQLCDISVSDLCIGDRVFVRPGSRIPVDGTVIQGHSFVDQAAITGESIPVEKIAGAPVYAGTINQSGALEVRTQNFGRDTAFGRIIEVVERAEQSRAPIQKTADRYAGYLVYFAIACAIITFMITRNPRSTIAVIIVAGACGIAAGTPLAIFGAIGRCARQGSIVKGGLYLELLGAADTVVFDKTGTLTFGDPEVVEIRPSNSVNADVLLQTAASSELPSEHPLGRAILKHARSAGVSTIQPERFAYQPGKGVTAQIGDAEVIVGSPALLVERGVHIEQIDSGQESSEVLVAKGGLLLGAIRIADKLRPESSEAVQALQRMGLATALLTGDSRQIAQRVGSDLGVDETVSELLPDQKVAWISKRMKGGHTVVMVGDGINDAPALMEASVGVAMGSGTDVAREAADVLLLGNDLSKLVDAIRIARRCRRIIAFNFAGTLAVDGVGVLLAAFGLLNPALAAFIHVFSELGFILNSARLLP